MANVAQAPITFQGPTTVATGTSTQIIQYNSTGTTNGFTAGNFALISPESNILNGVRFSVKYSGWYKSHGASQAVALGLNLNAYTSATAPTGNGTATCTPVSSGPLLAGTTYNFSFSQDFIGTSQASTVVGSNPVVLFAAAPVTYSAGTTAIACTFAGPSQTEPITGVNNTISWPLAQFYATFADAVSDTTATLALTEFYMQVS
jgi:hypothetical protein